MEDFAVSISNLSKEFPGKVALENVSFDIKKGSIHGLLGPNGAGKSTLMSILAKLSKKTSGDIRYSENENEFLIGILPESAPLYQDMTVSDYLGFVFEIHTLKKISNEELERCLFNCGLEEVKGRIIAHLSKGFKQRVGIAQAVVHNPDFVILDEPTLALDPQSVIEIRKLILDLGKLHTVLISTHLLNEVSILCDEITILNNGKVLKSGNVLNIKNDLAHQKSLTLKFQNSNVDLKHILMAKFPLDVLSITKNQNIEILEVELKTSEDLRARIIDFCVSEALGLFELFENELTLEEIFKNTVDPEST